MNALAAREWAGASACQSALRLVLLSSNRKALSRMIDRTRSGASASGSIAPCALQGYTCEANASGRRHTRQSSLASVRSHAYNRCHRRCRPPAPPPCRRVPCSHSMAQAAPSQYMPAYRRTYHFHPRVPSAASPATDRESHGVSATTGDSSALCEASPCERRVDCSFAYLEPAGGRSTTFGPSRGHALGLYHGFTHSINSVHPFTF